MSTRMTKIESGEMHVSQGSLRELAKLQDAFDPEASSLVDQLRGVEGSHHDQWKERETIDQR